MRAYDHNNYKFVPHAAWLANWEKKQRLIRNLKLGLLILAAIPLVCLLMVSAIPFLLSAVGLRYLAIMEQELGEEENDG